MRIFFLGVSLPTALGTGSRKPATEAATGLRSCSCVPLADN
jgi:hypothetical protein